MPEFAGQGYFLSRFTVSVSLRYRNPKEKQPHLSDSNLYQIAQRVTNCSGRIAKRNTDIETGRGEGVRRE